MFSPIHILVLCIISTIYNTPFMLLSNHLSYFYFILYGYHLELHSFPTRRSSDLLKHCSASEVAAAITGIIRHCTEMQIKQRSEEHTSELQSQSNLVCRLLLEKKKL